MKKWLAVWVVCLLCWGSLSAQSRYRLGTMPQVNLNHKFAGGWKLNTKLESRQLISQGLWGQNNEPGFAYSLTDLAVQVGKKTGLNQSFSGGGLLRLDNGQLIGRLIQQYSVVQKYPFFRLGHRFVADQTFVPDEPMALRLRYRIGLDLAFSGQEVDPREFYLKITHEYLNQFQDAAYDLELRFTPMFGYAFTDNNKLEWGLDYRLDSLISGDPRSSFWIKIAWYFSV
jgi:hypothetical protein